MEEYPTNTPSIDLESNLVTLDVSFNTKYLELNILKYDKLGLRVTHNSYDVFLMIWHKLICT
jgi:hypothetical protein